MPAPLPPLEFDARPVPPAGYGLYAAATITETGASRRHLGGVNIRPYNCDEGFGTYSALMCDPDETPAVKAALRALPGDTFEPIVVWSADECATDVTEEEALARAVQTLALNEQLLVESALGARLIADSAPAQVVESFEEGLGVLEEFLGEQGYVGYIHAARRWMPAATQYRWTNQTGALYRSPGGHGYVFGGGYASVLGDTLIATGPLYVWRDTPFQEVVTTGSSPVPALNNSVYAMTERVVVAGYECAIKAVTITPPTP